MNTSFILAVIAALFGSIFIGLPIGHLLLSILPMGAPFIAKLAVGFMLGALYVVWVYHNTPTKNKTVVFWLGTYRVRMGPNRKGFVEGLNAMPLGWPFFVPKDHFVGEKTEPFNQTSAYTEDKIVALVEGTYQWYVEDPYDTYNIETPEEALRSLILRSTRSAAEKYKATALILEDKEELSKQILGKVQTELASGSAPWGLGVTDILRVNHIRLPENFEKALQQVQQEEVEGQYEETQAKRRREQVEQLTQMGIKPDVAYTGSLIDAGKSGASMQNISLHGLEGMGHLFDDIGALGRGLSDLVKGKTASEGGTK